MVGRVCIVLVEVNWFIDKPNRKPMLCVVLTRVDVVAHLKKQTGLNRAAFVRVSLHTHSPDFLMEVSQIMRKFGGLSHCGAHNPGDFNGNFQWGQSVHSKNWGESISPQPRWTWVVHHQDFLPKSSNLLDQAPEYWVPRWATWGSRWIYRPLEKIPPSGNMPGL